jgi:hypothetical protein
MNQALDDYRNQQNKQSSLQSMDDYLAPVVNNNIFDSSAPGGYESQVSKVPGYVPRMEGEELYNYIYEQVYTKSGVEQMHDDYIDVIFGPGKGQFALDEYVKPMEEAEDDLNMSAQVFAYMGPKAADRNEAARSALKAYMDRINKKEASLLQKEIELKEELAKKLKQLKDAKTPSSINKAKGQMDALEAASRSYYTDDATQAALNVTNINDIGLLGPFNIDIHFAEEYTITIVDAFLTSRGSMIQIDENAIVEEYSFFARDIKYN